MDPIAKEHREAMTRVMQALVEMFPGMGVTLMVFDIGDQGRMNYASNADRSSMLTAMKEFVAVLEGRKFDEPERLQ